MPTVRAIPGTRGYLLAFERILSQAAGNILVLRYYPTLGRLLAGRFSAAADLPRRFSPYNNGTPAILAVTWRGALARSVIELGFHYEAAVDGHRGADREALGTLVGFRHWTAWRDERIDAALDRLGLAGNHGDWREFSFEEGNWRVYEAQQRLGSFSTWHLLIGRGNSGEITPLTLSTGTGVRITSVGNPVANIEPVPTGNGEVLVVSAFVFDASVGADEGELVYYVPV